MSQLSDVNFKAIWNNSTTGRFLTNTTQEIGSDDLRQFAEDIADSYLNLTDAAYNGPRGLKNIAQTLAAFKAIPTTTIELGVCVIWTDINADGGQFRICRLYSGTGLADDEKIIVPDDYATTGKYWYVLFNSQRYYTAGAIWNEIYSIADLKAIPTDDIDDLIEGTKVIFKATSGNSLECYQLEIGTNTENSPTVILPNDYHATDNQKFWRRAEVATPHTDIRYYHQEEYLHTPSGFGIDGSVTLDTIGIDSTENAVGVVAIATGVSTTGISALSLGTDAMVFGNGHTFKLQFRAALSALSDGTDTYTAYIGFADNALTGDMTDGAYFRYTHSVNSGEWQGVTSQASTRSTLDTNIAGNTVYRVFGIEVNSTGTLVTFYIDGVSVGTIATNIPTTTNRFGIVMKIEKSAGTTSRKLLIDWHDLLITRTTAR